MVSLHFADGVCVCSVVCVGLAHIAGVKSCEVSIFSDMQ